ncbi:MAG TPA: methyltransferase domain-containing protein, partial [Gemmatimonadota bacterium]|nr:methyltransferase domain-containing protein [Gemmatimonadota bacterium]
MSRPVWGKSEVERIFSHEGIGDQWSGRYEGPEHDLDDHNFRLRRDFAVALAEERSGASGLILDLGCGAGPVLAELRARSLPCVGLDYSADMLRSATGRLRKRGL